MQAVILAAGRSTRTYPLTISRPKPLVPLWDRPLLAHQLGQLEGLVDEVLLVVGFLKEQIEERFGDSFGGMRLRYVVQEQQRGTADALLAARPLISAPVLVLNGDDFYHRHDLKGLAERGRGLLVIQASDPQNRAMVTMEGDRITDIVEKPENPPRGAWCSVGGYAVQKEDLRRLDDVRPSPRRELELPDFVLDLVRSLGVRAKRIERFWLPITYS
ncbi:MAG: sugar phosphate nucleotidyltransferase, partial [Vicinamibacteria bacterium]